jgi:hypothetical protein
MVKGIRYDQLTPLILGPEGSLVVLTLRRTNGVIIDVHLRRARVGPVGRPAERRRTQKQRIGAPETLQTLVEDDERCVYVCFVRVFVHKRCVCVCVYIHIYIHTYIHTCIHE